MAKWLVCESPICNPHLAEYERIAKQYQDRNLYSPTTPVIVHEIAKVTTQLVHTPHVFVRPNGRGGEIYKCQTCGTERKY